ncbi:biotin--[acetyl-CoA-carboxylase] ligase [Allokutzneria albata]|uniref:biotin--[biotin carboxyl-carrier protein] ligase n=1 Tax=Allokutzneria albata TaxID=211114 RepID=A0A1H0BBK8_ALLAB|nr:biotin--[acetyl-CoA-carboxylase] ligase [Allokutzneria albata]SDN43019.1 BirA family transcriptional regulator, biotin operon repressor / biotin-[acetyl-CoA-carboxylase] ligase [Allokutzneria albata]
MIADLAALHADALRAELLAPAGPYTALDVLERTGSTNTDLAAAAREGAPDRTVLIAEEQTAGRGRNTRSWVSPARAGIHVSVLLRPAGVPVARFGWLMMLGGVVVQRVLGGLCGVDAVLKWPNDLLVGPDRAKCCGVLAEAVGGANPAVVLGIGVNVHQRADELPVGPGGLPPTSLALQGAECLDRDRILVELLRELDFAERQWREHAGDPVLSGLVERYRQVCGTLGQRVRVELPAAGGANRFLNGVAEDVDDDGRLVVRTANGSAQPISAGDVVHLRPASQAE